MATRNVLYLFNRFKIQNKLPIVRHRFITLTNEHYFRPLSVLHQHRCFSSSSIKGKVMPFSCFGFMFTQLKTYFFFVSDKPPIIEQAPQILSKLFPQTATTNEKTDEERQQEQQKKDEEDKKQQESSQKQMKLG